MNSHVGTQELDHITLIMIKNWLIDRVNQSTDTDDDPINGFQ